MHQHTVAVTDIVCMEILNLKVIDLYRAFKYLVLYFLDNYVLAVKRYEYISRTKLTSLRPSHVKV